MKAEVGKLYIGKLLKSCEKHKIQHTKDKSKEKEIPGSASLIHIHQCNQNKQNLEKNIGDVGGLVTITILNTKINQVENKNSNVSGLVKKIDYDAKILDIMKENISLLLIITNLRATYLMQN